MLEKFAKGKIDKLIVSVPPQHGKSYAASTMMPAYLLGLNPDFRICIASYSFALARRFGASVQRVIETTEYQKIFPQTKLKGMEGATKNAGEQRTVDEFDVVGRKGGLRVVGREGALTGNRVDVMIMDDMYKDAAEANSPIIRQNVWEWYTTVVRTRMHNDSRELMVFTRWHQEDLIGRVLEAEKQEWSVVNFEAIKTMPPSELDPRKVGEVLWPKRHSKKLLLQRKAIDPVAFEALYQGNPKPVEGMLYAEFRRYGEQETKQIVRRGAYIDTADSGKDYLCAVAYGVTKDGIVMVTDVVYTQEPMEISERMCAEMLCAADTQVCYVESNNGGRGFARVLQRLVPRCRVESFHQGANKVSRIASNATEVVRIIRMPQGWEDRWREFWAAVTSMRREIQANMNDDAADALTGIVEKEMELLGGRVNKVSFSALGGAKKKNY